MANPYSTPLTARYKYKPLDVSVLAQPLAQQQQQYDLTEQAVDAAQFELAGLSPDSERAKEIKAVLGEQVGDISEGLLSKRDYRTAAKNLNKLNKFYNSNEEIKAIKGNYDAWQDAIKEQKKRLTGKNADLTQKEYEEWYQKSMIEFRDKGGTDFREGEYNTVNTMGRMSNMDEEIQEWAYKLANARPDEKRTILGKIQDVAGHRFKDQVIDTIVTYQNKDDITAELYNQLSTSDRFKSWLDEKAEYNHFFQSYGNPEYAADMYGKYHAHLDEQEENIIKSKAKKKQKEAALANIEEQRQSLTEGYAKSKGDYIKGMSKQAYTQDYLMGVSSSMADVFNFQNVEYDRTFVEDWEAKENYKNAMKAAEEAQNMNFTLTPNLHTPQGGGAGGSMLSEDDVTGLKNSTVVMDDLIGSSSLSNGGKTWTPEAGSGFKGLESNIIGTNRTLNELTQKLRKLDYERRQKVSSAKNQEEVDKINSDYMQANGGLINEQKQLETSLGGLKARYDREEQRVASVLTNKLEGLIADGKEKGQDVSWYTNQLNLLQNNIRKPWDDSFGDGTHMSNYLQGLKSETDSKYLLSPVAAVEAGAVLTDGSLALGVDMSNNGLLYTSIPYSRNDDDIKNREEVQISRMPNEKDRERIKKGFQTNKDGKGGNPALVGNHDKILTFNITSTDDKRALVGGARKFKVQAAERRTAWKKMLEESGYTVIQKEQSLGQKHAYFDDIVEYELVAIPNSLIEKQKAYANDPTRNYASTLTQGLAQGLYDQQGSRTTQDQGIVFNDAANTVSGGVFQNLVDYQQGDTNNSNTHRFYADTQGSYDMVESTGENPNLNLYEPREIVGTTSVNGKQVPLIRYALKQDLTEGQIINEISRTGNIKAQTGGMTADEKRTWSGANMGILADDWRNVFSTDVVMGTLGTSFALNEARTNTKKNFEKVAQWGNGEQTANALTQFAQTEISLDSGLQDRLALDYIDLSQGTAEEVNHMGTPFRLENGAMARYDITYTSLGGGQVSQTVTLVDANKYPNETRGVKVVDQNLSSTGVLNSDMPSFMRSYELLYGVNSNTPYIQTIQNLDQSRVGR
jgi:hypothetical protein